jgi:redox-sensitive bicupin YhaK (pirin superfamily)
MDNFKIIESKEMGEGQGATVKRIFPTRNHPKHHDPFVLMDEFFVKSPASFPKHEHRGFEAVTYMLEGSFVHEDNLGNNSEVNAGGLQTFSAGKSIIHSEKPGETGYSHGIQLWVNLPTKLKKSDPTYQQLKEAKVIKDNNEVKIKKVLGENISVDLNTEIEYLDIELNKNNTLEQKINKNHQGLIYVVKGSIKINNNDLKEGNAIFFEKIEKVNIKSIQKSRFLIITGKPLNQEINIRGSFVE